MSPSLVALISAFIKRPCYAREMLVIPKTTRRSRSDATHSRGFVLFALDRLLPQPPNLPLSQRTVWVVRKPQMSIRARLYSKQKAGNMCTSI